MVRQPGAGAPGQQEDAGEYCRDQRAAGKALDDAECDEELKFPEKAQPSDASVNTRVEIANSQRSVNTRVSQPVSGSR